MGLPVARTRIGVYVVSGFCSSPGGVLLSFYMLSGLTGGSGYVFGTVLACSCPA